MPCCFSRSAGRSQTTPKDALGSVLKAVENKRFDYLTAQLADPAFVDDRVQRLYGGRFEQQVEDTQDRLAPSAAKLLGRFLKDGEWTTEKDAANVRLKDVKDRAVFFKRVGGSAVFYAAIVSQVLVIGIYLFGKYDPAHEIGYLWLNPIGCALCTSVPCGAM